jgi:ATP-dependent Lon protease
MNFHPYSEVFPIIAGDQFEELVEDIKEHGLREKIWTYEGKILDGRNRFLACKKAKVKPEYREFKGKDPLSFIVSLNVSRRHLSEAQRAMAAARIATLKLGSNQHAEGASRDAPSQSKAAEQMDVSRSSVQRAKQVIEKGSKALQSAVEKGDVPLKRAASVVDLPKAEQLKAATQPPAPQPIQITPAPDFDFEGYEPENDETFKQNIENVLMADDKLAALTEQLKQVHRELAAVKSSRDHYMSESGVAVRTVKARDRDIERLNRELAKLKQENERLQERVAIMESAA